MANKKEKETTGKPKKVKVEILASNMAGKYGLPYSPGNITELEAKQAAECIEAGDAKEVK